MRAGGFSLGFLQTATFPLACVNHAAFCYELRSASLHPRLIMNLGFLIAFGLVSTTFIGWGVVGVWDAAAYSVAQHTPGCDVSS